MPNLYFNQKRTESFLAASMNCPSSPHLISTVLLNLLRAGLFSCQLSRPYKGRVSIQSIHVKERNAIFPFPESCPFFSESERKAGLIWKGRKGTGKERYDGAKFPFLSISDFPIWKTKFSISSKKVIKLGGHFLEFCITSNGRALVGALVGVMEGHFYHVELTW